MVLARLRRAQPESGAQARLIARLTFLRTFGLDAFEDLFTMHGDVLRRVDTHAHLIALDAENGDRDFLADHDGLADASR